MDGEKGLLVDFDGNVIVARQIRQLVGVVGTSDAAQDAVEVDDGPVRHLDMFVERLVGHQLADVAEGLLGLLARNPEEGDAQGGELFRGHDA